MNLSAQELNAILQSCKETMLEYEQTIEAARQVDRIRIGKGLEPVNTFRPKLSDLSDLKG